MLENFSQRVEAQSPSSAGATKGTKSPSHTSLQLSWQWDLPELMWQPHPVPTTVMFKEWLWDLGVLPNLFPPNPLKYLAAIHDQKESSHQDHSK